MHFYWNNFNNNGLNNSNNTGMFLQYISFSKKINKKIK